MKIRSLVPVFFAAWLGGATNSCWSFSDPTYGASAGAAGVTPPDNSGASPSGDSDGTDPSQPGGSTTDGNVGAVDNAGSAGAGNSGSSDTPGNSEVSSPTTPLDPAGGDTPGGDSAGAAGNSSGTPGASDPPDDTPAAPRTPCEILEAGGQPCVAAHSTTRVVFGGYTGPLYQVCRGASAPGPNSCPGGVTLDIGSIEGGYADSAAQDAFCGGGNCTISIIYDQSGSGNFLKPAPAGGAKPTPDNPANAADLKTTLAGHSVYGVFIRVGMGYRAGCTGCGTPEPIGTAVGDEPETMYMVTSANGLVNGCCFDYGNGETTSRDDGNGTMEALYFGGGVVWGTGSPGGHDNGPWVMADLENGLYAGWENNQDQGISSNTPLRLPFVTGVVVGDTADRNGGRGRFAIYGGNATIGTLKTLYDGIRPEKPGYVPMQKQGSIILGIGGDNSGSGAGQWFEGVMASGAASKATVDALQANIIAAGYGK
ncbi:MAG TPA: arabinofuranosidase catalytic domain-containing protein [Polyangiaceae bacterium]|nr:arabinofuranosidase catalytic domain-containing protein [Polyangiaceae bacterium]